MSISRRDFIGTGAAAAAAGLALPKLASAETVVTNVVDRASLAPVTRAFTPPPVVVGAANGFISKNANGKTGIEVAYDMLTRGGDPLDAVIAGVNVVELDPKDQSVGLGGLPNEEGVVQLDASVMHGPCLLIKS
jgi:N4-(beta-N-acetylglucosaminyl)-L-asparaginase